MTQFRDRQSRRTHGEKLDEDLAYTAQRLRCYLDERKIETLEDVAFVVGCLMARRAPLARQRAFWPRGPIRKAASFRGRTGDGSLGSSSAATQRAGRDRRSHSDHGAEDEGLNAVDQFRAKTDFLDVDARVRIFRQAGTPTVAVGF